MPRRIRKSEHIEVDLVDVRGHVWQETGKVFDDGYGMLPKQVICARCGSEGRRYSVSQFVCGKVGGCRGER